MLLAIFQLWNCWLLQLTLFQYYHLTMPTSTYLISLWPDVSPGPAMHGSPTSRAQTSPVIIITVMKLSPPEFSLLHILRFSFLLLHCNPSHLKIIIVVFWLWIDEWMLNEYSWQYYNFVLFYSCYVTSLYWPNLSALQLCKELLSLCIDDLRVKCLEYVCLFVFSFVILLTRQSWHGMCSEQETYWICLKFFKTSRQELRAWILKLQMYYYPRLC